MNRVLFVVVALFVASSVFADSISENGVYRIDSLNVTSPDGYTLTISDRGVLDIGNLQYSLIDSNLEIDNEISLTSLISNGFIAASVGVGVGPSEEYPFFFGNYETGAVFFSDQTKEYYYDFSNVIEIENHFIFSAKYYAFCYDVNKSDKELWYVRWSTLGEYPRAKIASSIKVEDQILRIILKDGTNIMIDIESGEMFKNHGGS